LVPANLPPGTQWQRLVFTAEPAAGRRVLLEGPGPVPRRAVVLEGDGVADLELLTVPWTDGVAGEAARPGWLGDWMEAGAARPGVVTLLLTLQGAQILWRPGRAVLLAPADRLDLARRALVEFALVEGELRQLEEELGGGWAGLEADAPLAFEFDERAAGRRAELGRRFQQAIRARARVARLLPQVQRPAVYPPTLATQVAERLRERTRLAERADFLGGQLDLFERVYELCGHRSSEFALSRKSLTLEWVIIVLLAVQTLLVVIDMLSNLE
jgi:hypothetical protein